MRRVLFDENMPRQLRRHLDGCEVRTAQEEGWSGLKNGKLLAKAAASFDVLLTADQRMRFQQNLARFDIAVVVIEVRDTTIENLLPLLPTIRDALSRAVSGKVVVVMPPKPA